MPIDLQMEQPLPDVHDPLTTDYAKELHNKLSFAHERARRHLICNKVQFVRNLIMTRKQREARLTKECLCR